MCSEGGKSCVGQRVHLLLSHPPPSRQDAASGQGWVNRVFRSEPVTLSYGCGLKVKLAGSLWPDSWLSVDASVNGGVGVGGSTPNDPSSNVPSKWKAEATTFSACGFPLCFCISSIFEMSPSACR